MELPTINPAQLLANPWVRYVVILMVGITIGALFYPTKHIEEKLTKIHQEEMAQLNEQHQTQMKSLVDLYAATVKEEKQIKEESDLKINKLTQENSTLKSRMRTSHYKLVKPDGTIEERDFSDSEVDQTQQVVTSIQTEFKQKVDSIEKKWSDIHQQRVTQIQTEFDSKEQSYKKTIDELQKSKTVSVNEKSHGIEAGMMTNKDYYGHATMDLWGPMFIGVHGEVGPANPSVGAGVGIRF